MVVGAHYHFVARRYVDYSLPIRRSWLQTWENAIFFFSRDFGICAVCSWLLQTWYRSRYLEQKKRSTSNPQSRDSLVLMKHTHRIHISETLNSISNPPLPPLPSTIALDKTVHTCGEIVKPHSYLIFQIKYSDSARMAGCVFCSSSSSWNKRSGLPGAWLRLRLTMHSLCRRLVIRMLTLDWNWDSGPWCDIMH